MTGGRCGLCVGVGGICGEEGDTGEDSVVVEFVREEGGVFIAGEGGERMGEL